MVWCGRWVISIGLLLYTSTRARGDAHSSNELLRNVGRGAYRDVEEGVVVVGLSVPSTTSGSNPLALIQVTSNQVNLM